MFVVCCLFCLVCCCVSVFGVCGLMFVVVCWFVVNSLLCVVSGSLSVVRCSSFGLVGGCALFVVCCWIRVVGWLVGWWFVVCGSLSVRVCLLLVCCCLMVSVCCWSFAVRGLMFVVRRLLFAVCGLLCVVVVSCLALLLLVRGS